MLRSCQALIAEKLFSSSARSNVLQPAITTIIRQSKSLTQPAGQAGRQTAGWPMSSAQGKERTLRLRARVINLAVKTFKMMAKNEAPIRISWTSDDYLYGGGQVYQSATLSPGLSFRKMQLLTVPSTTP